MHDFAAVLNCMDGRVQVKANDYFSTVFGARNVDTVTAPGMIQHIAEQTDRNGQIMSDLLISLEKHGASQIGVVAHADCAGNPVADDVQKAQVSQAVALLGERFPGAEVAGIWIAVDGGLETIA